ncbi:MAG: DUF5686 and carboxypeptidase regulatory-like domain-containing protein [Saprospiraceae bacterium]
MRIIILFFLLQPFFADAQLTGTVLDEFGAPLPYASVYERNSTRGVTSNANGKFRLPLEVGSHEVVFHMIGYKQQIIQCEVKSGGTDITVQMEPTSFEIGEVVITDQDPAIRIMREAISRREINKKKIADYSCDVYIKGFHQLADAPEKILGQEVGNLGGILDTNRQGVIYLSESVSKLYVQAKPERKKEQMISSKVSGDENGFSLNRATLTDFNLYEERINIDREILSPLADTAFNYYDFKLRGKYKDINGFSIYKIQVIPKRPVDPSFSGFVHIVDGNYNLGGVELAISGNSIKQPILDTLWITQEFVPVEAPDKWCLLSQLTEFRFSVLGFKVDGLFNSVFSQYNIYPSFPDDFFDKEVFKIEDSATKQDSNYWNAIRPIPLTEREIKDYVVKDSLSKIWESKEFMDSMDARGNKFKPFDLLMGYTYSNSYKNLNVSWPAAVNWVQNNTVQGWVFNIEPRLSKYIGENESSYWRATGNLNYGFKEEKLRGGIQIQHRLESIHYTSLNFQAGIYLRQFDEKAPIGPLANTLYTLLEKQNFMKLFEKQFAALDYGRTFENGWRITLGAEWARRKALSNTSEYTWYKKEPERFFTPNGPIYPDTPYEPYFNTDEAIYLEAGITIRPGAKYSTYPDFRQYEFPNAPIIRFNIRQAIPIKDGSPNYLKAAMDIGMRNWTWGLIGYSSWNIETGGFIYKKQAAFIDAYHPLANQTMFGKPRRYYKSFLRMPYYENSTFGPYVDVHWQHHFQGFILDRIPLLRKLNWKEVLTVNAFYADSFAVQAGQTKLPYWEIGAGMENIGFKLFRPFRIDWVWSFSAQNYLNSGLVIGINF